MSFADDFDGGDDQFGYMVGENVGPTLKAAFEELAGIPTDPADILGRFTDQELADTAVPGPRSATERRSFTRNLQRWRKGRTPTEQAGPRGRPLRRLRRAGRRLVMNDLLRRVDRRGVTILGVELELVKSEANEANPDAEGARMRVIRGPWYLSPRNLHDKGFFPPAYADRWADAALAFFRAFFEAYDLGEWATVESLGSITLLVGRP